MKGSKKERNKIFATIVLATVIFAIAIVAFRFCRKIEKIKKLYPYVDCLSKQYLVEKPLIFAVIDAESAFDENAVSEKGAIGLMQLMPETAFFAADMLGMKLKGEEIAIKEINLLLGASYMKYLLDKFESIELAVAAYNAGEGNVSSWLGRGIIKKTNFDLNDVPFAETRDYCKKVSRNRKLYNAILKIFFEERGTAAKLKQRN